MFAPAPSLYRDRLRPEDAGLTPVDTGADGFRRRRCGKGFTYLDTSGRRLGGKQAARLKALAIPPAWEDVWICPDPDGHILAYGTDDQGRRQYIYHPDWLEAANAAKFSDMAHFAEALPRVRAHVRRILESSDDNALVAHATVVRLMDRAGLRIGSYAHYRRTGARGALSLGRDNIEINGHRVRLNFTGKGGQAQEIEIDDPYLYESLKQILKTSSELVFRDDRRRVTEASLNAMMAELFGRSFTAKDFRTWGGSVAATAWLRRNAEPTLKGVAEAAADWLGNTPAIAQSSYIHPAILEAARTVRVPDDPGRPTRLRVDERACLGVIRSAA
ncbi:DNA topoisomerase IB [Hyphobacterium sp.]|jgi:DNA topoisomerase-1|uniref:DNA topoisomerase IB n=1 Tax=Hyphobacterium sp. TaxID=2004662 RepID=UPI003BA94347